MHVSLKSLGLVPSETKQISIDGQSFWITADSEGLPAQILLNRCAHMGNRVEKISEGFVCKFHGWVYKTDGSNEVPRNPSLEKIVFKIMDDIAFLDLPNDAKLGSKEGTLNGDESLELLSHASFLLSANKKSVLFDPWLSGPTYWGSWHLWPENHVEIEKLSVTDVVITHPHPDHFHIPTLEKISRTVKIHIPNFESGILQKTLRNLGFTDIQLVPWETRHFIEEGIELSFLRPMSQWEDSSCLVSVNGWLWLNQNDSGAALKDELLPDKLDLLTSSFSVGASGYPLTWNVGKGRSSAILRNSKAQILQSVVDRARSVNAAYYAPFASWWRHGLEEHQDFDIAIPHTDLSELRDLFKSEVTELIETIPSSKILLREMSHSFNVEVANRLGAAPHPVPFLEPSMQIGSKDLARELRSYMGQLQQLAMATQVESVLFVLQVEEIGFQEDFRFGDSQEKQLVEVTAKIPGWVAELLVSEDETATWNHLDIGYWVRWSRNPDIYPSNFMRLLQLGRVDGLMAPTSSIGDTSVTSRSISDFIEKDPELARAIMSRSGLPCSGCAKSNADSLQSAFEIHKVSPALRERAVNQLSALLLAGKDESFFE